MFDFSENCKIARKAAAEGMVLLKNLNNTLPFSKKDKVGIIGEDCLELIRGGGGSAGVLSLNPKTVIDGLNEKDSEGKFTFFKDSAELAKGKLVYTVDELNKLSENITKSIVVIKRDACEGVDRLIGKDVSHSTESTINATGEIYDDIEDITDGIDQRGYYLPHKYECMLLDNIEKSNIKEVVVILNIASVVDLTFLNKYSKVKSILLTYLPGVEGGSAIADVLCGDVNPSGKLTDTFAISYEDYPSASYYNISQDYSEYKEEIFVGYRHFETYAKDKVLYPFGFGLSYTNFVISKSSVDIDNDKVNINVKVKNIGTVPGKEVVQVYFNAPAGKLKKPYLQLADYAKTKLLSPNESEILELSFNIRDMASFDEDICSYILEHGTYKFFVGNSIRNIENVGEYSVEKTVVTQVLSMQVTGEQEQNQYTEENCEKAGIDCGVTLYDVAEGKHTIEEFVRQLKTEELIHLAQGQHPDFAKGTAGVGNIKKYQIPNPQTADGPAGLRKSVPTTHFPCPTLLATSYDKDLVFQVGKAMGYEGISTGVDILLAPGINIHRNPLCGRNFEYYSEDPYVAGKTAAAMINGIQSEGLCTTIKHFFANNCELNRLDNNSIISERTAREIYLRGFEIAIRESNPAYVMSAYNLINGVRCSSNKNLLTNILRKEWGYEGAVMTDWRAKSRLWEEIKAGNNIKMPSGYPDEAQLALEKYNEGILTRFELEQNAIPIIKSVMKTNRFKTKNFGIIHKVSGNKGNKIDVMKTLGISSTRVGTGVRDEHKYLCSLSKDQREYPTFVYYAIDVEHDGEYSFSADVKTDCQQATLWISVDDEIACKISCGMAVDDEIWYEVSDKILLTQGEHILKIMVVTDPNEKFEYHNDYYYTAEKFALDNIILNRT